MRLAPLGRHFTVGLGERGIPTLLAIESSPTYHPDLGDSETHLAFWDLLKATETTLCGSSCTSTGNPAYIIY
jgi:hypothetical protein